MKYKKRSQTNGGALFVILYKKNLEAVKDDNVLVAASPDLPGFKATGKI